MSTIVLGCGPQQLDAVPCVQTAIGRRSFAYYTGQSATARQ